MGLKMNRTFIFLICFIFLSAGPLMAFDVKRHNAELGIGLSHITYEEPDFNLKEEGIMYGIAGSYTYHNKFMFKLEGNGSLGTVDYSSSSSGEIDNIRNYLLEARVLFGYDFPLSTSSLITPYIGFGYRYLNDDPSGKISSFGARGYERESNYFYSPIGLMAWIKLGQGWVVGPMAEYDYLWKGKQRSHLGDAITGFPTIENEQRTGYGLRGSVKFQKMFTGIGLNIEPFIKYWNIKRSENEYFNSGYFYEPRNNSTEYGLILSAVF